MFETHASPLWKVAHLWMLRIDDLPHDLPIQHGDFPVRTSSNNQSVCIFGFVWKCWVYSQWNSHLIGIMISKTIGFRGLASFQTHPFGWVQWPTNIPWGSMPIRDEILGRQRCCSSFRPTPAAGAPGRIVHQSTFRESGGCWSPPSTWKPSNYLAEYRWRKKGTHQPENSWKVIHQWGYSPSPFTTIIILQPEIWNPTCAELLRQLPYVANLEGQTSGHQSLQVGCLVLMIRWERWDISTQKGADLMTGVIHSSSFFLLPSSFFLLPAAHHWAPRELDLTASASSSESISLQKLLASSTAVSAHTDPIQGLCLYLPLCTHGLQLSLVTHGPEPYGKLQISLGTHGPEYMPERMSEYMPECQIECQSIWQKECQIKCQIDCQSTCQ